jgi:hypothetical protein
MSREYPDEGQVRLVAGRLQAAPRPRCPQLRPCQAEGLYPVQGYCTLAESPGWFMIPSIEEYRESCTTARWGACGWFRGESHDGTSWVTALPAPGGGPRPAGARVPPPPGRLSGGTRAGGTPRAGDQ